MEHLAYGTDGQLAAGSFMDYAMPRASDMPKLGLGYANIPARTNPLGVKGVGETSVIASPAVIYHAILDALLPHGVEEIEMPVTPERVLRALQAKRT
jgi:carbon-monoxide dehydrogenase large subunit